MNGVHSSVPSEVRKSRKYDHPGWVASQLRHMLQPGKKGALKCKQLASLLNIKTDRTYLNIRTAAKQLLAEGLPVVTCAKGLFLAVSRKELEEHKQTLLTSIKGLQRTVDLVEKVAAHHFDKPEQKELVFDYTFINYHGSVYCLSCAKKKDIPTEPSRFVEPIRAGQSWGYYPKCEDCGKEFTEVNLVD